MNPLTSFIFVVFGSTGQYEDYRTWAVGAAVNQNDADLLCERLNDWAREERVHADGEIRAKDWQVTSPHDPSFSCDGGVRYTVVQVPQVGPSGMGFITAPLTFRMSLKAA